MDKNNKNNNKNSNLDKIIKESNESNKDNKSKESNKSNKSSIDINPISRFGCLDFECMYSKIKKDDKAYKIFSLYSNLIYQVCSNCDGYHFTCPEYICSADRPRMDIYKSYNKGGE